MTPNSKEIHNEQFPGDNSLFNSILSSIQDGIVVLDSCAIIQQANPTMERWYPHMMPLAGKLFCQVFHGTPNPTCVQCPAHQALKTGQLAKSTMPRKDADGRFMGWLEFTAYPIKDSNGGLKGITVSLRDITEVKRSSDRQKSISEGMGAVVSIADSLLAIPNLDTVYRLAVEKAREQLGLDRAALFIYDGHHLWGTYGTDMRGATTDEHTFRMPNSDQMIARLKALEATDRRLVDEHVHYWEYGTLGPSKGSGWVVLTPIQSPMGVIGLFSNDAAISQEPMDKDRQDVVSVYCSLLGAIIESKRSEAALKESEARYRGLFDHSLNGFSLHEIILDKKGTAVDFRYLEVNKAFEEHTGLKASEVVGRTAREALPGIEKESFIETYAQVALTGKPIRFEQYSAALNKTFDIAAFSPRPGQFATIFTDITERKNSEVENRRLAAAVQQAAEAVMITDPSGLIQYVNPAFTRMTGFSVEEAVGQTSRILLSQKHPSTFYENIWKTLAAGHNWMGHIINKKKDGALYEADLTISPIRSADGTTINYVGIYRDVTKEAELGRQLRQAQKMEAVGRLAGGIAHDFNNLLTSILGYSKLAIDQLEEGNPLRADILQIERASERAAELTRQLLMMSRKQSGEISRIDLNALLMEIERLLLRTLGSDIHVTTRLDEALGSIEADAGQLQQVFMNLAINARDAMPAGGTLSFETRNVVLGPKDLFNKPVLKPGPYVMVQISDTGTGMPAEVREHIFEPFFTTKDEGKGTGLGLSTAYGIVRQFNGLIEFDSETGKGTTFRMFFPKVTTPSEQRVLLAEPAVGGQETILLVEDDDVVRTLTLRHLTSLGYNVLVAAHGDEAMQLAKQQAGVLHLILADVSLPRQSGPELIKAIRAFRQDFQVIYASGHTRETVRDQYDLPTSAAILQKPYSLEDLAAKVRESLDSRTEQTPTT